MGIYGTPTKPGVSNGKRGKMAEPSVNHHLRDPDTVLIYAIAGGNHQALDELYQKYGRGILGYLCNYVNDPVLAEEVLQDVMLAVWKSAATFRGEAKVLTWLLTIARNRAINAQRRQKPTIVAYDEELGIRANDTSPLEIIERESRDSAVREAIKALPPMHREILVLVFYYQLSGNEIADVLGISVGTVKSRLHRAKEALRRVLYREGSL